MTTSLPESILEVAEAVSLASDSFDVWWDLQAACNHDDYESVLEEYRHFFRATIRAHLVTLIVRSYIRSSTNSRERVQFVACLVDFNGTHRVLQ